MLFRRPDGCKPGRWKAQESNGSTPSVIAEESGKHGWLCERKPSQRQHQADGVGAKTQGRIACGKLHVGRTAGERLWREKPKSVGS